MCSWVCTHTRVLAGEKDGRGRERACGRARTRQTERVGASGPSTQCYIMLTSTSSLPQLTQERTNSQTASSEPPAVSGRINSLYCCGQAVCLSTYRHTDGRRQTQRQVGKTTVQVGKQCGVKLARQVHVLMYIYKCACVPQRRRWLPKRPVFKATVTPMMPEAASSGMRSLPWSTLPKPFVLRRKGMSLATPALRPWQTSSSEPNRSVGSPNPAKTMESYLAGPKGSARALPTAAKTC